MEGSTEEPRDVGASRLLQVVRELSLFYPRLPHHVITRFRVTIKGRSDQALNTRRFYGVSCIRIRKFCRQDWRLARN